MSAAERDTSEVGTVGFTLAFPAIEYEGSLWAVLRARASFSKGTFELELRRGVEVKHIDVDSEQAHALLDAQEQWAEFHFTGWVPAKKEE